MIKVIEKDYLDDISKLEKDRDNIFVEIYNKVKEEIEILEKYYKPVQDFIDNNKVVNNNVNLSFNVTISAAQFKEEFMKYIKNIIDNK